ncbi:MAG: OmpW family outer membrane protein, partial [Acidobacteriota bacterium]
MRRKGGAPTTIDAPLCFTMNVEAWMIDVEDDEGRVYTFAIPKKCMNFSLLSVTEPELPPKTDAVCKLDVQRDCRANTWRIDASGSSAGVSVTMASAGGARRTVIAAGADPVFTGPDDDPFTAYTFTAVVPDSDTVNGCRADRTAEACPPLPSCTIRVDVTDDVLVDTPVQVTIDGSWDGPGALRVEAFDEDGNAVPGTELNGSGTVTFAKAGTYTFRGEAQNRIGQTATCDEAAVIVKRKGQWIGRAYGALIDVDRADVSESRFLADGTHEADKAIIGDGAGFGVSLEYLTSVGLGIEASAMFAQIAGDYFYDLDDAWGMDDDDLRFIPLTLGLNYHFNPDGPVDVFAGVFAGIALLDDASFQVLDNVVRSIELDDEFIWGLQLGLDVPFGDSPWGFHAAARYMDLETEFDADGIDATPLDLDLSPTIFSAGVAYRF